MGLLSGGDIEIMEFRPPETTFVFSYEQRILIWTPPNIFLKLGFEVSVTVNYALVLDSKGIREAVQQEKPEKALSSIGIRDIIDGVDTNIVTFSITVYAAIEVSGRYSSVIISQMYLYLILVSNPLLSPPQLSL